MDQFDLAHLFTGPCLTYGRERSSQPFLTPHFDLPFVTMLLIFWVLLLVTICFAGLVTFIVLLCMKKIKISREEEEESIGKQIGALFTSPGLYLFYAVTIFLFLESYVPPIVKYFVNNLK